MNRIHIPNKKVCKPKGKRSWLFPAMVVLMTVICFVYAYRNHPYVNFFPINGTFQNFNPVRRLLDGQMPYRDFQDYLGLGHLYIGTVFTVLFGGNYKASLLAFTFLTTISFALISFTLGWSILRRKKPAIIITIILVLMLMIFDKYITDFLLHYIEPLFSAVSAALDPKNSARYIRGMILPLLVLVLLAGNALINKRECKSNFINKHKMLSGFAACGILGGIGFAWSNDYGISCWVCMIVMVAWVALSKTRNLPKTLLYTGATILSSLISLFITIEIATIGHFGEWFRFTCGTGGYQAWYYNADRSFYLFHIDLSHLVLFQAVVCLVYLIKVFREHGSNRALVRYGIPAFMNMVCYCAANEYRLMSGGYSQEVSVCVLLLTCFFELCALLSNCIRKKRVLIGRLSVVFVVLISGIFMCQSARIILYGNDYETQERVHLEALGGELTSLGEDILLTHEFLDGDDFFATYASAQEVVEDTYQPSGTDYIIHILGDQSRADYLESFLNGDHKYTATIRKEFTGWERWIERANWFFYRELYQNWHPVYGNSYELFWERNTTERENTISDGIEVSTQIIDDTTIKVMVNADKSVNGIADVYIDYSTNSRQGNIKSAILNLFLLRKMVHILDTGLHGPISGGYSLDYDGHFLRGTSAEYIPVAMIEGYGEVTISALPSEAVQLTLNDVYCHDIYTASNYIQTANHTDEEWTNGVSVDNTTLLLKYSDKLWVKLGSADSISVGQQNFKVLNIEHDDKWVKVTVDTDASACRYPAVMQLKFDPVKAE